MTGKNAIPWAGIALAIAACVGAIVAGASAWLAFSILVIWVGSLWLAKPEAAATDGGRPREADPREVMNSVIEPLGAPLVLFDQDRILAANAAARRALGAHIIGQDPRIALRHPDAVRLLELSDEDSVTVRSLTTPRSLWQMTRRRIDDRYWIIELDDRTTEADISRAHTDFVANASHELRTPLAAIIGYIETLSDGADTVDRETTARFHATVLREAKRMEHLVSDLMSLSQLEADKHDPPREEVDLVSLSARVVGEFTATIGAARIELARPDDPMPVTGDAKQLEQLLRNLIDNGLKYGDPEKPVAIALAVGRNQAEMTVADQGAGVSAEHLPHLTRRFYRTDPGRSRAAGGTGLGLAIVKHIVERHRGKLDIVSTEGVGTTVTVRLPMKANGAVAGSEMQ